MKEYYKDMKNGTVKEAKSSKPLDQEQVDFRSNP